MRARKTKSFQNLSVRNDFNIKTSKTEWFFKNKLSKYHPARSCGFVRNPTLFKHFCEKGLCEQLCHVLRTSATTVAQIKFQETLAKNYTKWTFARAMRNLSKTLVFVTI